MNIAGVKVGEIGKVELEDGARGRRAEDQAQVQADLPRRDDAPAAEDRPEGHDRRARPGHAGRRRAARGRRASRLAQTLPDVNPDEILAQLDGDTREYLQILLNAGGEAFTDDRRRATAVLRRRPARDVQALRADHARRREVHGPRWRSGARTPPRVIHNFSLLAEELARQGHAARRARRLLQRRLPALRRPGRNLRARAPAVAARRSTTTETTLAKVEPLADVLGPTLQALLPDRAQPRPDADATRARSCATTTPIIRDQLRPFARAAQPGAGAAPARPSELAPTTTPPAHASSTS